jgi:ABC-type uncharacterized transport system ATPase subunit
MDAEQTEVFFNLINKIRDFGAGILIISHKIDEVLRISDTITVLRHGKSSLAPPDVSKSALLDLMFRPDQPSGKHYSVIEAPLEAAAPAKNAENASPVLEIRKMQVSQNGFAPVRGVSFSVHAWEICAIAGVKESGRDTALLAAAGLVPIDNGEVRIKGSRMDRQAKASRFARKSIISPLAFRLAGGVYIDSPAPPLTRVSARSPLRCPPPTI